MNFEISARPLVSIITPVFNSQNFLRETIYSVIKQSFREWELILIDDCSTDGSAQIAKEFSELDNRIKLLQLEENFGAAIARNAGIRAACGRYLAFLDSDDVWKENKLKSQLYFMQSNGYSFSYSWYECIDEHGISTGKVFQPPFRLSYYDLLKSNQIGCLTSMYDTDRLGKVYMPLIRKRQDYGLWLKILRLEQYAYCVPEPLAKYRVRTGSISRNKLEMLKYNWQLYRKLESLSVVKTLYYLGWNIMRKVTK